MASDAKQGSAGLMFRRYGTPAGLVLICLLFAMLEPDAFPTLRNLRNVAQQMSVLAIIAAAATFVMVIREFDLSVGFLASWAAVCCFALFQADVPVAAAVLLALASCLAMGLVNGVLVAVFGVPSFIATLAFGTVIGGLAYWGSGGESLFSGVPDSFKTLGRADLFGVPVLAIWMLGIAAVSAFILGQTELGRRFHAIGSNAEAAFLAGVPVARDRIIAFAIAGALAGLAGLLLAARLGSVQHTMGDALLLPAYAAVFLGTTAFRDGQPNIAGTLVGVAIIAVLANGLTMVGVEPFFQQMLTGTIIILAVLVRQLSGKGGS